MNGWKVSRQKRSGRAIRQHLRVLDRVELRDDLADDALGGGDQDVRDRQRDRACDRCPDPAFEQWLEQMLDARLAQRTDPDRGHRDPDLAGGDVVPNLVELGERQPSASGALVSQRLEPFASRAHQCILGDDEERIHQDEYPGEEDEQRVHFPAALPLPNPASCPAAQPSARELLLRDGSSSFINRRGER